MFKKEDFKVGMVVEINGFPKAADGLYVVTLDDQENLVFVDAKGYTLLADYDDDFKYKDPACNRHIDKIYSCSGIIYKQITTDLSCRVLLWERTPETKEMTIAEIEKELGYPIKIVNKKEK